MTPAAAQVRSEQADRLLGIVSTATCCSLYGLSNAGKSQLLRSLPGYAARQPDAANMLLVYVDCNRIVENTAHGFFEVIMRSLLEALEEDDDAAPSTALLATLREHHQAITSAASGFRASLAFNNGIAEACAGLGRNLVLLLDEFDEIYVAIEERALLNLRALKDKYRERLTYLTATIRPLTDPGLRAENEFAELFTSAHVPTQPLSADDTSRVIDFSGGATIPAESRAQIVSLSGGHYGLVSALTQAALRHSPSLANDANARAECLKIWNQLRPDEQHALAVLATNGDEGLNPLDREHLTTFGLLDAQGRLFSPLFKAFLARQGARVQSNEQGVFVDEDAGEVRVDGEKISVLTDLEYRLMQLLAQRQDRLTTKEMIVEAVWNGSYMDRVDDARIEKLVSRLRAKIEPDPLKPRYLLTQRGRGYKLVSKPSLGDADA